MAGANQIRVCLDDTEKFCDCLQAIITTVRSRILNLNHQVCAATNACQTKSARYGIDNCWNAFYSNVAKISQNMSQLQSITTQQVPLKSMLANFQVFASRTDTRVKSLMERIKPSDSRSPLTTEPNKHAPLHTEQSPQHPISTTMECTQTEPYIPKIFSLNTTTHQQHAAAVTRTPSLQDFGLHASTLAFLKHHESPSPSSAELKMNLDMKFVNLSDSSPSLSDMNKDVEPVALFSTPQTPTSSCDTPSALGNNDSLETTVTPKDDLFDTQVPSQLKIKYVTAMEISSVPKYLQCQMTLQQLNNYITRINDAFTVNASITKEQLSARLGLGKQTKLIIVLLLRLKRLKSTFNSGVTFFHMC